MIIFITPEYKDDLCSSQGTKKLPEGLTTDILKEIKAKILPGVFIFPGPWEQIANKVTSK